MKRLYILGNGFDVAHKLPTAYLDYRKFFERQYKKIRFLYTYGRYIWIRGEYRLLVERI